jgi:Zn-dependent peptidase ImmA (M78 family)
VARAPGDGSRGSGALRPRGLVAIGLAPIAELYGERQSVERAFAAELLAPGAALRERLGVTGVVSSADLEEAADDLGVSPFVVWHQVHNQRDLSIVD